MRSILNRVKIIDVTFLFFRLSLLSFLQRVLVPSLPISLRDYIRSLYRKTIFPLSISLSNYISFTLLAIIVPNYLIDNLYNDVYISRLSHLAFPFGRQSVGDKLLIAYV